MANHVIKLILTVRTEPDLDTFKYNIGDTFTFTSDDGDVRSQCSVPAVPAIGLTPMRVPKGGTFTTYPLPKEPFSCNCGLTLAGGVEVGWPHDPDAGNMTGGGN